MTNTSNVHPLPTITTEGGEPLQTQTFDQIVAALRANQCRVIDDHRSCFPPDQRDRLVHAVAQYGQYTVLIDIEAKAFSLNPITTDTENIPHLRRTSVGVLSAGHKSGIQQAIAEFNDPANYLPRHREHLIPLTNLRYL